MNHNFSFWENKFNYLCNFTLDCYMYINEIVSHVIFIYKDGNDKYDSVLMVIDPGEKMEDFLERVSRITGQTSPIGVFLGFGANMRMTITENNESEIVEGDMIVFVLQTPNYYLFKAFPFKETDAGLKVENNMYQTHGDISELDTLRVRIFQHKNI